MLGFDECSSDNEKIPYFLKKFFFYCCHNPEVDHTNYRHDYSDFDVGQNTEMYREYSLVRTCSYCLEG